VTTLIFDELTDTQESRLMKQLLSIYVTTKDFTLKYASYLSCIKSNQNSYCFILTVCCSLRY